MKDQVLSKIAELEKLLAGAPSSNLAAIKIRGKLAACVAIANEDWPKDAKAEQKQAEKA